MKIKTKKYTAVVIGCGKIGTQKANYKKEIRPATHAEAYQKNSRIQLVGLIDVNLQKRQAAKRCFPNIQIFDNAQKCLEQIRPDIVSIATPPDSHASLVALAARFKTPAILCEKPISNSLQSAKKIVADCKKNKSLLFINHQRHFDPLLQKWQIKVKKGLLGKVKQCTCFYYNGLFNNGTHIIDLLRYFLGEVSWVIAMNNPETRNVKSDESVDALIYFKNKATTALQSLPQNYGLQNFCFYGTKGQLTIKNLTCEIEYRKLVKNKFYSGYYQLSNNIEKEGKIRSFMESAIQHIANVLDNKEKPRSTGQDGLAALKILLALQKSAKNNGQRIFLTT